MKCMGFRIVMSVLGVATKGCGSDGEMGMMRMRMMRMMRSWKIDSIIPHSHSLSHSLPLSFIYSDSLDADMCVRVFTSVAMRMIRVDRGDVS